MSERRAAERPSLARVCIAALIAPASLVIFYPIAAMNPMLPKYGNWLAEMRWSIVLGTLLVSYAWWTIVGLPVHVALQKAGRTRVEHYVTASMVAAFLTVSLLSFGVFSVAGPTESPVALGSMVFVAGFFASVAVILVAALFWYVITSPAARRG